MHDIDGLITFFYYNDLQRASVFYSEILGFELVIDVNFARVYKIYERTHIGLVDAKKGYLKASTDKPVMVSFFVKNVDAWYNYLVEKGIEIEQEPRQAEYLRMKTLLFRDPEGYLIEVLEWLAEPYG